MVDVVLWNDVSRYPAVVPCGRYVCYDICLILIIRNRSMSSNKLRIKMLLCVNLYVCQVQIEIDLLDKTDWILLG